MSQVELPYCTLLRTNAYIFIDESFFVHICVYFTPNRNQICDMMGKLIFSEFNKDSKYPVFEIFMFYPLINAHFYEKNATKRLIEFY